MANYTITLTVEEETALTDMGITNLQSYVKAICASHIDSSINDELVSSTKEEKVKMLKAK